MLIVPVVEGLDWRRPPPVTLALILANLLVFFLYQSGDAARHRRAAEAYFSSSLPAVELPTYVEHLKEKNPRLARQAEPVAAAAVEGRLEHPRMGEWLLSHLQNDEAFMKALRESRVVTPSQPAYARWKEERGRIDALYGELSFRRFGFTPVDPRPVTWLTSMFLHGDLMHLLGNMVFLFIVGVAVESALGGWRYALLYIAGGLAGDALFLAMHAGSTVPSVGASGAISGLMGLFTVVFGLRKVNFFYWLLFVFGFRPMRGIVVLPVWVGYELLQFAVNRDSNVGYMAHAGGLIGGALLGLLVRRFGAAERVDRFHEAREREAFDHAEYQRARALVAKLDFKGASAVFARLAQRFPQEEELLRQWHAVARADPASDHYHRVAGLVLALPRPAAPLRAFQRDVLLDYLARARPAPRLEPRVLGRAAIAFARGGDTATAERAAEALFRSAPGDPHLPVVWDHLAKAFAAPDAGTEALAKARRYRALIGAQARAKA